VALTIKSCKNVGKNLRPLENIKKRDKIIPSLLKE
jgi:hypothetical protein